MRKMDEMETKIALDSIKWAWSYTIIVLFLWGVFDFIKLGNITLPFYLLITQNIVYFFATQISKWKAGDNSGKKCLLWYFPAVIVCIIAFGVILFFLER